MRPEAADHLERARERLSAASNIAGLQIWDVAAREAYLAAYHAAEALIFERYGKAAKTHHGVRSLFGRLTKGDLRVDRALRRFLSDGYDLKQAADYETGPEAVVTMEQARGALETAAQFVDCVAPMLNEEEP